MVKVLVADDARDIVRLLSCTLAAQGYEVLAAYDGARALSLASAERPDVILLDIAMPRIDGLEVCRRLKADARLAPIPVIMVTGRDSQEDVVAGLDAGADDYVIKPFDQAILFARLRSATRVKSSHDTISRINRQLREEIAFRMKAEQETTALRQRIEFILGATKTGLAIVDSEYKLVYVDPQWQERSGAIDGKSCYQYFRDNRRPCEDCVLARAMSTKTVAVGESALPKEGNRPVQVSCIPFQDERGDWFYAEVNVDISERKVLERELAQAQKLEAIGHLAAGIAHEINTPTQYIGDNIRFLEDAFADLDKVLKAVDRLLETAPKGAASEELFDGVREAIRQADIAYLNKEIPLAIRQSLDGVGRVASIVRAMKEFSHPGSERKQAIDLNHAIENTLTVSRNEWKYVAEVITDLDPDLPSVVCLPNYINQVILNVVVNAAQAIEEVLRRGTQEKGTITISTRRDENCGGRGNPRCRHRPGHPQAPALEGVRSVLHDKGGR